MRVGTCAVMRKLFSFAVHRSTRTAVPRPSKFTRGYRVALVDSESGEIVDVVTPIHRVGNIDLEAMLEWLHGWNRTCHKRGDIGLTAAIVRVES